MVSEHKIYQTSIFDLLAEAGFEPEDVRVLHVEYDNVWAEVFVRDEHGQFITDRDEYGGIQPATTVVPLKWVGQFYDEAELQ